MRLNAKEINVRTRQRKLIQQQEKDHPPINEYALNEEIHKLKNEPIFDCEILLEYELCYTREEIKELGIAWQKSDKAFKYDSQGLKKTDCYKIKIHLGYFTTSYTVDTNKIKEVLGNKIDFDKTYRLSFNQLQSILKGVGSFSTMKFLLRRKAQRRLENKEGGVS